ncbi:hypothetical protein C7S14_8059 [Burkholderia cepacia]|nr:hypothetical protein C7S14_8059 [Burkholderia cepacia]
MRVKRLMEIRDCRIRARGGRGSSSGRCGCGLTSINAPAGRWRDSGRMRGGDVVILLSARAVYMPYSISSEISTR